MYGSKVSWNGNPERFNGFDGRAVGVGWGDCTYKSHKRDKDKNLPTYDSKSYIYIYIWYYIWLLIYDEHHANGHIYDPFFPALSLSQARWSVRSPFPARQQWSWISQWCDLDLSLGFLGKFNDLTVTEAWNHGLDIGKSSPNDGRTIQVSEIL